MKGINYIHRTPFCRGVLFHMLGTENRIQLGLTLHLTLRAHYPPLDARKRDFYQLSSVVIAGSAVAISLSECPTSRTSTNLSRFLRNYINHFHSPVRPLWPFILCFSEPRTSFTPALLLTFSCWFTTTVVGIILTNPRFSQVSFTYVSTTPFHHF